MAKETKKETEKQNPEKKNDIKFLKFLLIAVIILVAGYFALSSLIEKPKIPDNNMQKKVEQKQEHPEPQFKKQGELEFLKSGSRKQISKIDIELSATDSSRMMGLMWRKSMEENRGMLFIFEDVDLHSFWMKNTIMSLDIIFITEKLEIINIHKKAKPYSTDALPSLKPAKYVVEVIAGYTDKFDIKPGDIIKFSEDNK